MEQSSTSVCKSNNGLILLTVVAFLVFLLTVQPLAANEPKKKAVVFPIMLQCLPGDPDEMLEQKYNEIPFVEGPASVTLINGKQLFGTFKMFLSIDTNPTFSIIFSSDTLSCLVMTGKEIKAVIQGDKV